MEKQIISRLNETFEEPAYTENGIECWMARDLQRLLDYTERRNQRFETKDANRRAYYR